MRLIISIVTLATLIGSFAPALAQDSEIVDRVIAVVDDEIILESEVLQFVQDIVIRNRDQYDSQAKIETLRQNVLEELINQKILVSIAEGDTNIIVEDRKVDMTLDERIGQVTREIGGEAELERYYGKPIRQIRRDFREQVRQSLLIDRVRAQQMQKVNITREDVLEFYNGMEGRLPMMPERVRLSHILLEIEPAETALQRAKTRADSLFQQLVLGADFDSLAMKYSADKASAKKGGLLGTTERGDLVPDYEAVAYNLEEGEISEPIRTRFGYHIIRLNWRRGEKINTNHILVMVQATAEDEARVQETAEMIRDKIESGEMSFEEAAKQYSSDKETARLGGDLGWFDLGNMPSEFKQVADALEEGEVSDPFKSTVGIHLVRLVKHEQQRPLDLDNDWERISQMALRQKQDQYYANWLDEQREDVYIRVLVDEI